MSMATSLNPFELQDDLSLGILCDSLLWLEQIEISHQTRGVRRVRHYLAGETAKIYRETREFCQNDFVPHDMHFL